jgi:DHA1 family 2-module integral membrane pump EmrD-like MFS transporter
MARWMPETARLARRAPGFTSYKTLFGNTAFNCYLLMLIGGLAGIAVRSLFRRADGRGWA